MITVFGHTFGKNKPLLNPDEFLTRDQADAYVLTA